MQKVLLLATFLLKLELMYKFIIGDIDFHLKHHIFIANCRPQDFYWRPPVFRFTSIFIGEPLNCHWRPQNFRFKPLIFINDPQIFS